MTGKCRFCHTTTDLYLPTICNECARQFDDGPDQHEGDDDDAE